jgi:hypothetical protein
MPVTAGIDDLNMQCACYMGVSAADSLCQLQANAAAAAGILRLLYDLMPQCNIESLKSLDIAALQIVARSGQLRCACSQHTLCDCT